MIGPMKFKLRCSLQEPAIFEPLSGVIRGDGKMTLRRPPMLDIICTMHAYSCICGPH
jgi:hypothetical protein